MEICHQKSIKKIFIINNLLKLWTCSDIKCELKDLKKRKKSVKKWKKLEW